MTLVPFHSTVFGPVRSRRLGISLGINTVPSPSAECGPECMHCRTGAAAAVPIISRSNAVPSSGVIVTSVARRIIEMHRASEKLEAVTVTGNGDPTMHPYLLEISENLRDLRTKWFPKAKFALISESRALSCPELRAVCAIYDRPIFTFEWGTAKTYDAFRPSVTLDYKTLVERFQPLDRWIAQATFVQGALDNSNDREVLAWIKKLEEIRPREVHIMTPEGKARGGVKSISASRLEEIAAKVMEKTGIPTELVSREAQPV